MTKERIDKIVVERGLAENRTRAQAMILAGQVLVSDQRIDKPGQMVDVGAEIRIKGESLRYASRGGLKLEAALKAFNVDPKGKNCIDVGASTGGFTDCLLQHGAARVWAVDVGHNQLVWRLRQDPRVEVMEGVNARELDPARFPVRFDLATVDVSFISLRMVLPSLALLLADDADCIALVKPQFEVGRGEVGKGGIVKDSLKHRRVLKSIRGTADDCGLIAVSVMASPILGAKGNREFLMLLKPRKTVPAPGDDLDRQIDCLTSG
jgi:23S rRNA (cytidine1920-2'-O)/16S rRNA (cytidine1409-2'-O)-methyltransferase